MQRINKRPIYFANLTGTPEVMEIIEGESYRTGESKMEYSSPVLLEVNISAGRSGKIDRIFGEKLSYERYFLIENLPSGFDESSIIWSKNNHLTENADYKIKAIYPYLGHFVVLIESVAS